MLFGIREVISRIEVVLFPPIPGSILDMAHSTAACRRQSLTICLNKGLVAIVQIVGSAFFLFRMEGPVGDGIVGQKEGMYQVGRIK